MGVAVRDEGKKVNSNINVTPMVDVMLVLLIIFMVITPMLQNKVQIDMAKAENATAMPDADKDDAIVVAVTRDGAVFLGRTRWIPASWAAWCATSCRTRPTRRSMSAPTRGLSTRPSKTPLTMCARRAWKKWAC